MYNRYIVCVLCTQKCNILHKSAATIHWCGGDQFAELKSAAFLILCAGLRLVP